MANVDDYLAMLANKLGVKSSKPAYKPSSYLDGVQRLEQGKNITPIPDWANVIQAKAPDPLNPDLSLPTQSPSQYEVQRNSGNELSEYKQPDQFERGEDVIQLLLEAEGRAGVSNPDVYGHGSKEGVTYFQTPRAYDGNDMTEDQALEYIHFLSEGQE